MGRNSPLHEIDDHTTANGANTATTTTTTATTNNTTTATNNDLGLHSIRDRFPLKRNPSSRSSRDRTKPSSTIDRHSGKQHRLPHHGRFNRKGLFSLFHFRGVYLFYFIIFFAVFAFAMASMVLESSITEMVFRPGYERIVRRSVRQGLKFGSTLRFVPGGVSRQLANRDGLDRERTAVRKGIRGPRLALIVGNMKKDPRSLMLFSVAKNLQRLGYVLKIFAVRNGEAKSMWEQISGQISVLGPEQYGHIDWLIFEGVVADSLEVKEAISSLMQEPFDLIPLIWTIQEDTLAKRLSMYKETGLEHLISSWRNAFSRASLVVFPDFSLPMLYSALDTGNFFVIPGSPVDVWAAESYSKTREKHKMRKGYGFNDDDMVVLVVGSSFFYDELSWDYAVAMHALGPLLTKYTRKNDAGRSFKFIFLFGNSTDGYNNDALQEIASRLGLLKGSLTHYGLNSDVNGILSMSDIVLYGSSQEEQGFPSLIIRAMTFGIPVISPDCPIVKKYVTDGTHAIFYPKHDPDALLKAFSLLISNGRLSKFAQTRAASAKLLAKNLLASECITGYAKLLEKVINFPSDVLLPAPVSHIQQGSWEWNMFRKEMELGNDDYSRNSSVVYDLEQEFTNHSVSSNIAENDSENLKQDIPSELDWDVLKAIEDFEDYERLESEELKERMEEESGVWDEIYRNARKAEKLKFEANERDEGELERTGQPVCIYEIYSGTGAWPFLHHGSLYRGLSLSRRATRLRSDDVDAVLRLPILNDTYYRDILCEMGGMFSIAYKVDNIHRRPWIGFQSWRAAGRQVSLYPEAEKVLEGRIQGTKGDIMYFWSRLDVDGVKGTGSSDLQSFWSVCDILNGGNCRTAFKKAFRQMYILPSNMEALPPMPEGGHWSALHSWVMPTSSFLEFIMFSRMFTDSLDALHDNSNETNMCMLGSSHLEKKHCYCRMLELLVNVWAYHSGRRMVYLDPRTGSLQEQHRVEQRQEHMWVKYFNLTLLKSMDEDLAEAADDDDHPRKMWLWPWTGEVHWQGIYEREREERYRLKMDKKRKMKEKLYDRMRFGYKQKSLG